ncbi:PP0621 family protein [Thioalkalivibrio sp. ALJ24]|uniref:PP0621 family protein n=1 Tax=Thioalkalivibrio sp. ALJ24 TaxID=545276 RepID=UPI00036304FA|nr:PP0621 family protein [Thioalkalivibrio sp. ALJ24]
MRLLLLIIAIVAIFLAVRTLVRSSGAHHRVQRDEPPERLRESGAMVRCAHCGVHIPEDQAVHRGEDRYCSAEHAKAGHRSDD